MSDISAKHDIQIVLDDEERYFTEILRLSYTCNEKCLFCNVVPKPEDKDPANFTLESIKKNIAALVESGVESMALTGGEPTLHKDIIQIIRFASEKLQWVSIQTNALKCSKSFSNKLKEAGLSGAFVSFHSHVPEVQDILTATPGSFDRTVKGIRNLLDAGIKVNINTVVNSLNQELLPGFAEYVINHFPDIGSLCISFVQPHGLAQKNPKILPDYQKARPFLRDAVHLCRDASFSVNNPACGVPACFWEGSLNYCNELMVSQDLRKNGRDNTIEWFDKIIQEKTKGPECRECYLKNLCCGYFPIYKKLRPDTKMEPRFLSYKYWE